MKSLRAGGFVVNKDNKIALANEHLWGFPRGGVDEGEDFGTAARREVEEEVGLKEFVSVEKLGVYERYPEGINKDTPGAYPMEIHIFLFKTDYNGELLPKDENVREAGWFTYEEALDKLINEVDREFLVSQWTKVQELNSEIKNN